MSKKAKSTTLSTAPTPTPAASLNGLVEMPLELILPNPEQPRVTFNLMELDDLAQSIRENGVIQPVIVEPAENGMYYLHAGERRTRAARLAGLTTIPAVITPRLNGHGGQDRLVRALVENLQRADMNPVEEAKGYQRLVEMGFSMNDIALKMGISSARVASRLKILELDQPIQDLIQSGKLSKDNRLTAALMDIPDSAARVKMAKTLADRNASITAGLEACDRLKHSLQAKKISSNEIPAIQLASQKAGAVNRPIWNAFSSVGKVPPWPLMEISVRDTCNRCGLRDVASETTCNGCALVELLRQMIGATQ